MANQERGGGGGEERRPPLHGDILERIITHLPTLDLVPASYVSKPWRRAVSSSVLRSPRRLHAPWLVLHLQSRQNPSNPLLTYAYDPYARDWLRIPRSSTGGVQDSLLLCSSHSGVLHTLTLTKLSLSFDAFASTWTAIPAPRVWRTDAAVAIVGSRVVAAGGVCDIEDEQTAVEVCKINKDGSSSSSTPVWETCEPMPAAFKDSAAATWLSVAVSADKMYVMDRNAGWFCCFDPESKRWGLPVRRVQPDPAVYLAAIGFCGRRLIYVGVSGEAERVVGVRLWEVDPVTMRCEDQVGEMPREMVERLAGAESAGLWSIGFSSLGEYGYIYDKSSRPKVVVMCEINGSTGCCGWESIDIPEAVIDNIPMLAVAFGCSTPGFADLKELTLLGKK